MFDALLPAWSDFRVKSWLSRNIYWLNTWCISFEFTKVVICLSVLDELRWCVACGPLARPLRLLSYSDSNSTSLSQFLIFIHVCFGILFHN